MSANLTIENISIPEIFSLSKSYTSIWNVYRQTQYNKNCERYDSSYDFRLN
jgi:hypothetical protein